MKHLYLILISIGLLVPYVAGAQSAPLTEPNKLVFKLKPAASASLAKNNTSNSVQQVVKKVAKIPAKQKFPNSAPDARTRALHKNAVDLSLIYELNYTPGQSYEQIKKELLSTGMVEYVEPLYRYEPLFIPNDPRAHPATGNQEYLSKIEAYAAWDVTQGDTNVVIGILDTGVRLQHEDLKGNIKYNYNDPIDGIDNDNDGYVDNFYGWDLADNDNNPTADGNGHGTLVAGVAAAATNNEVGIAGVGFKCKFLPIKVFASTENGAFSGYEGIVYAADQGCKIINLSWGGVGFPSAFEQDVVNYASINRNVVIVAAAGNTNQDLDFYPASYSNVLSVGSVTRDDIKSPNHTYSYAIKIAAQGSAVYTTGNNSNSHYGLGSGSSYATPMVSGAAALVRSHFPELTAPQVVERLRVTSDDIYDLPENEPYKEKLGRGRLNVNRALTEVSPKSTRLQTWQIEGGLTGKPGEVLDLTATFKNFLAPTSDLTITVTSASPHLEIVQGQFTAGSMATLEVKGNKSEPFRIRVAENTPANSQGVLRFGFTDGTYTDFQYIKFNLNPDFVTTDVNHIITSIMSRGNIAYEGMNLQIGNGFTYRGSNPLLAEGGLLIGYSPTLVSDNIRNDKGKTDNDFYAVSIIQRVQNSPMADFVATNIMEDSLTATKNLSTRITQNVYAWADAPNQDFVILQYVLTNRSEQPITEAYAGMYADWDVLSAARNVTEWNNNLKLGIIRHTSDTSVWVGIQVLSKGTPGFYALENSIQKEGVINISDGFTTQEKYEALSGGVQRTNAGTPETGSDVSYIISSKIAPLAPTEQDTVAFALVAGLTRQQIYQHAAAAAAKYEQLRGRVTSAPDEVLAKAVILYPNPTSGGVSITLPTALQKSPLTIQLVDSKGKTVHTTSFSQAEVANLNTAHLPNGLYFVRISSKDKVVVKKLLIQR
ncbi:S8/S53 family peptidase [Rufibacter roseus]|uniref:S8/S53 family peptidase n=1 Tax=Rufibacter roseus TaxID=1567108 RepID=A0ABW2DQ54_9BACT|nr:S8/S53 family peptidase [Rufibacter roseus]